MNLRSRINKNLIRCIPWRIWKGEIELLPVSSKTLFARHGLPIDLLEIDLISEGYLREGESLLNVLGEERNLKRLSEYDLESDFGMMPENWTKEDYEYYEESKL